MIDWITNLNLPPEVITFVLAMLPVSELRGAIPLGLGVFQMSYFSAFVTSWLGSIVPSIFLVYALGTFSRWLSRRSACFEKFFSWLFKRTHERFWKHHAKLGSLALVVFVAIPLPVTGVWTGSVAAFLFGIPKKSAVLLIALGSFVAGIIVSLVYFGFFSFFKFIL
ncbi:small multi-drug export protein [Patescibacteria group bacterium]|nr:small multi-drug export protein [Patescibacteria group bacterium]MBU1922323.1 small multi-drug export protein [Patescibacteria group bacterium]